MTDQDLRILPSKAAYAAFDAGWSTYSAPCTWLENTKTTLNDKLNGHDSVKAYVDQIVKAWCIVLNSGGMRTLGSTYCFPFYYWLGDILINKFKVNESFLSIMKTIYDEFKKIPGGEISGSENACAIIYDDSKIDKDTFNEMKAVYEYSQDHNKIKQHLKTRGNFCSEQYKKHLTNIKSAYEELNKKCPDSRSSSSSGDKHCQEYNRTYKKCIQNRLSELTCNIIPQEESSEGPQHASIQLQTGEVNSSSGTIPTTAISSVFSVLGIGVVATFLYKIWHLIILPYMMDDNHEHLKEEEGRMISLNRNKEEMWLITLHNASTEEKK
ncbi:Variable surface protein Vir7-like protein [Plasmodium coatneyi]|uniref:Variable surface protein Vir7-like protein n=1 Tax=Plasmodium coatneyi TaxID=208452 RepID=A0A1B1DVI2_9APIC|nr:Variable surface protein Vir7-like protein [Plasmodium coatneyi]ANQ06788.1 Variable surface protein Vir7-like protein [Plasmodium coatneyi]